MADVDQSGNVLARYTAKQNIDEPLAELRSSTTSYYSQDGLGSVTSLTSSAGALGNTYTYDSFGKLTASMGSIANRFEYTAREFDSETSLYFYRARYYDPLTGRFVSEDPRRDVARGMNFYPYVRSSAPNLVDPDGRIRVDWGGWGNVFNGALWARRLDAATNWVLCFAYCALCQGTERRQALNQAQGNGPGYTEDMLNQYLQTGSGDAGYNQHKMCPG